MPICSRTYELVSDGVSIKKENKSYFKKLKKNSFVKIKKNKINYKYSFLKNIIGEKIAKNIKEN